MRSQPWSASCESTRRAGRAHVDRALRAKVRPFFARSCWHPSDLSTYNLQELDQKPDLNRWAASLLKHAAGTRLAPPAEKESEEEESAVR